MTLIVCPLQFEAAVIRRALRRQGRNRSAIASATIMCCGPGAAGIDRFASSAPAEPGTTVILAGLGGALDERIRAGEAHIVGRVIDELGVAWIPPLPPSNDVTQSIAITSAHASMATAADRRDLAQRSGAHIVDLESIAFARLATARGWRWGVVRGVSDDLHAGLPAGIDRWIDARGRTRTFAVLAALLRHPRLLRDVRCLHHNSVRGLHVVATLLATWMPDRAAPPAIG